MRGLEHPVLSTSVSLEGGELLNDPDQIVNMFHNRVEMIVDGGILTSAPSSVVDLTGETPQVVREGAGDVSMFRP